MSIEELATWMEMIGQYIISVEVGGYYGVYYINEADVIETRDNKIIIDYQTDEIEININKITKVDNGEFDILIDIDCGFVTITAC